MTGRPHFIINGILHKLLFEDVYVDRVLCHMCVILFQIWDVGDCKVIDSFGPCSLCIIGGAYW